MSTSIRTFTLFGALLASLTLSSCSATGSAGTPADTRTAPASSGSSVAPAEAPELTEVAALAPRVVLTYDGGVMVVDGESGEVVSKIENEGFLRVNKAGDGRHVLVSDTDVFRVLDTGLIAQKHGDHYHYYEQTPSSTGDTIDAPHAGHVVRNAGKTALFADGNGAIKVMVSTAFSDGKITQAEVTEHSTKSAHHGVAVPLSSGNLLLTQGTEEARDTVQVISEEGKVLAETTNCPAVHGVTEAKQTKQGEVVSLGCENGPVIYRNGQFHKVPVEHEYQRSGNQFGTHESPIVLADYKTNPDAELERPTKIALIDTRADSLKTVDLGSAYWFRSLARGPEGEALVLTYDGELNILDEETGEILHEVPVVEPWQEKADWQSPGPAVKVGADGYAYVTDAAEQKLHVVDIADGKVLDSFDLPETPNEIAVVTGKPSASGGGDDEGHSGSHHDDGGKDHAGHDH